MSKLSKLATVPFAHLLGIRAETKDSQDDKDQEAKKADWAKKAESNPDRKQGDDEGDDDYVKRMEEMDEDDEKKDAKRAKDSDPETDMEGDDEKEQAVRRAERARCAKIIAHGIKHGCVNQAGVFAFDTALTSSQAIAALTAAKMDAPRSAGLSALMHGVALPNVGVGSPESPDMGNPVVGAKAMADRIVAAAAKARGEKV